MSHHKVEEVLNPYSTMSPSRLDEGTYTAYQTLSQLSRRSRYLLSEKQVKGNESDIKRACITYSKHLSKAVRHLQTIIDFMEKKHRQKIPKISIKCIDLKGTNLKTFNIV